MLKAVPVFFKIYLPSSPNTTYFFSDATLPRYGSGCPCAGTAWTLASSESILSSLNALRAVTSILPSMFFQFIVRFKLLLFEVDVSCSLHQFRICLTHRLFSKPLCHQDSLVDFLNNAPLILCQINYHVQIILSRGKFRLSTLQNKYIIDI